MPTGTRRLICFLIRTASNDEAGCVKRGEDGCVIREFPARWGKAGALLDVFGLTELRADGGRPNTYGAASNAPTRPGEVASELVL